MLFLIAWPKAEILHASDPAEAADHVFSIIYTACLILLSPKIKK